MLTFPLASYAEEQFAIVIFSKVYWCKQQWNTEGFWTLSFYTEEKEPIVTGIKLVAGLDLTRAYPEVLFNMRLQTLIEPTRENISLLVLEVTEK